MTASGSEDLIGNGQCANCTSDFLNKKDEKIMKLTVINSSAAIQEELSVLEIISQFYEISLVELQMIAVRFEKSIMCKIGSLNSNSTNCNDDHNNMGLLSATLCQKCAPLLKEMFRVQKEFDKLSHPDSYIRAVKKTQGRNLEQCAIVTSPSISVENVSNSDEVITGDVLLYSDDEDCHGIVEETEKESEIATTVVENNGSFAESEVVETLVETVSLLQSNSGQISNEDELDVNPLETEVRPIVHDVVIIDIDPDSPGAMETEYSESKDGDENVTQEEENINENGTDVTHVEKRTEGMLIKNEVEKGDKHNMVNITEDENGTEDVESQNEYENATEEVEILREDENETEDAEIVHEDDELQNEVENGAEDEEIQPEDEMAIKDTAVESDVQKGKEETVTVMVVKNEVEKGSEDTREKKEIKKASKDDAKKNEIKTPTKDTQIKNEVEKANVKNKNEVKEETKIMKNPIITPPEIKSLGEETTVLPRIRTRRFLIEKDKSGGRVAPVRMERSTITLSPAVENPVPKTDSSSRRSRLDDMLISNKDPGSREAGTSNVKSNISVADRNTQRRRRSRSLSITSISRCKKKKLTSSPAPKPTTSIPIPKPRTRSPVPKIQTRSAKSGNEMKSPDPKNSKTSSSGSVSRVSTPISKGRPSPPGTPKKNKISSSGSVSRVTTPISKSRPSPPGTPKKSKTSSSGSVSRVTTPISKGRTSSPGTVSKTSTPVSNKSKTSSHRTVKNSSTPVSKNQTRTSEPRMKISSSSSKSKPKTSDPGRRSKTSRHKSRTSTTIPPVKIKIPGHKSKSSKSSPVIKIKIPGHQSRTISTPEGSTKTSTPKPKENIVISPKTKESQSLVDKNKPSSSKSVSCPHCSKIFSGTDTKRNQNSLQMHIAENHKCFECNKLFSSPKNLKVHLLSHREVKIKTDVKPGDLILNPPDTEAHIIDVNPEAYLDRTSDASEPPGFMDSSTSMYNGADALFESLGLHSKRKEDSSHSNSSVTPNVSELNKTKVSEWVCQQPDCDEMFDDREALRTHIRVVHGSNRNLRCNICSEAFSSCTMMKEHINTAHPEEQKKPNQCTECGKGFPNKTALVRHNLSHGDERPFPCPFCNKAFKRKTHLNSHIKTHKPVYVKRTKKKSINACDLCGEICSSEQNVKKHKQEYHSVGKSSPSPPVKADTTKLLQKFKSFACNKCDQSFSTSDKLRVHMRLHKK